MTASRASINSVVTGRPSRSPRGRAGHPARVLTVAGRGHHHAGMLLLHRRPREQVRRRGVPAGPVQAKDQRRPRRLALGRAFRGHEEAVTERLSVAAAELAHRESITRPAGTLHAAGPPGPSRSMPGSGPWPSPRADARWTISGRKKAVAFMSGVSFRLEPGNRNASHRENALPNNRMRATTSFPSRVRMARRMFGAIELLRNRTEPSANKALKPLLW